MLIAMLSYSKFKAISCNAKSQ